MSELRSVVESLRSESLASLADAAVEEDFCELQRACEQLEVERLRRLAEIERRGLFQRDGHISLAAWLTARLGLRWGSARRDVRLARTLDQMPETRRAVHEGEIPLDAARVLARARETHPDAFPEAEAQLLEAARVHSVADLHRVTTFWSQHVTARQLGTADDAELRTRRNLHASVTLGGMVRVDGDLDPETGETFLAALDAVPDAEARSRTSEDTRSPTQRRADGLGELCRQWLDRSDRPVVAGERPHVSITVPLDTLTGERARAAELDRTGPIPSGVAERLSCDASIRRLVLSPASEPLDIGRATRVVPPAMRRALIVRDRHCRFPGCDRPQAWCDAHHVPLGQGRRDLAPQPAAVVQAASPTGAPGRRLRPRHRRRRSVVPPARRLPRGPSAPAMTGARFTSGERGWRSGRPGPCTSCRCRASHGRYEHGSGSKRRSMT